MPVWVEQCVPRMYYIMNCKFGLGCQSFTGHSLELVEGQRWSWRARECCTTHDMGHDVMVADVSQKTLYMCTCSNVRTARTPLITRHTVGSYIHTQHYIQKCMNAYEDQMRPVLTLLSAAYHGEATINCATQTTEVELCGASCSSSKARVLLSTCLRQ